MTRSSGTLAARRRPIIGASWKMNLTASEAAVYLATLRPLVAGVEDRDLFVLPAFPVIATARDHLTDSNVAWGAQDVHPDDAGPHTGDVSARMLADLGCRYVEVGHSERRRDHGESAVLVGHKVAAVLRWGMTPILCVGEDRRGGARAGLDVVIPSVATSLTGFRPDALSGLVVAYEPAWAIGEGGSAADPAEVADVHAGLRAWLVAAGLEDAGIRLIYGGSVDPSVAEALLEVPDVDGLFVGRSSLDPVAFATLARTRIRA